MVGLKKGIIFSVDAILALILVILLASWLPLQIYAGNEYGGGFESLARKAEARAILAMYNGSSSGETIASGKELGKCGVYYTIEKNNVLGTRDQPDKESFCEEAE